MSKGVAGVSLLPNYFQESKRSERMYDFYFSNYFAYYICKDKGEENRREPGASLV